MKAGAGNFFEDFHLGQRLVHPTPRTLGEADATLYAALTGSRFILQASAPFARRLGYRSRPLDDLLVFHTVFGKSVPDISLNAVANLGYAEGRFFRPVHAGETLHARSDVIGLKENSGGENGVVTVRTDGLDENDECVIQFTRWVMVKKRDPRSPPPTPLIPELVASVDPASLVPPCHVDFGVFFDTAQSGSSKLWNDYETGERIDHRDGVTLEDAEHMMATRLYQNTARVHFNAMEQGRFAKRVVYGGHVVSLARTLSFNGLANAVQILAINGGRHVNPLFAGGTVFAWSEVLDRYKLREDCGALRLRLVATKNLPSRDFPLWDDHGKYRGEIVLDFDYWALMPRA